MSTTDITDTATPEQVRHANAVARRHGYGKATTIIAGDQDRVVEHTRYGWRKNTTDEYVPNAYRRNFGWKNTYYQPALTTVEIAQETP